MASSSGMKASSSRSIKTCSNEFCGKSMTVSRPGWKFGDREVNLSDQCLSVGDNSQIVMGFQQEEIQDRPEEPKVKLIPLFEKKLTASDTGKSSWLVLPKNHAEKLCPSINDQESSKIVCQDIEWEDWRFTLRFSPKHKRRMYVLDKFDLYAKFTDLSLGDTVTFSRLDPEGKLIIGYRKKSSSNHLPRAANSSTYRLRDKRGTDQFYNVNGAKGKTNLAMPSMISHDDANEPPNVESDIMAPRFPVGARKKSVVVGSTSNSSRKKHKMSQVDTPYKSQEPLSSDHGVNDPFVTAAEGVKINSRKRKAVVRSSTPPPKKDLSRNKSVAKKIKNITRTTIASSKRTKTRNREPEPQATVEARVGPEPSYVTKKHPRHRTGCQCIICIQPPRGSKHSSTCSCHACDVKRLRVKTVKKKPSRKPPIRRQRKVPEPAEPSNQQTLTLGSGPEENRNEGRELSQLAQPSNQQTIIVNHNSEGNRNDQSLTGSQSNNPIRPLFDLNLPASDDGDE